MLKVYACLTQEHDFRLVLIAAFICFIAAFTGFATFERARTGRRLAWLALASFATGIGIWSTHFIAMLAYQPDLPAGYDMWGTLLSIVAAVLITGLGWSVAASRVQFASAAGGAIIGLGIGTMHYLGMSALKVPGRVEWDPSYVATSLLIGMGLAATSLATHRPGQQGLPWRSALLLTLAICGLHFVGMAAASIHPDPRVKVPAELVETGTVTVIVTATALLVLALSFAVALFDRSLAQKELQEAQRLQAMTDEVLRGAQERDRLAAELMIQAEISSAALNNMAQGISLFDEDERLVTHNERYARLYEIPPVLLIPGTPLRDILAHQVKVGNYPNPVGEYEREALTGGEGPSHTEVVLADGRIVEIQRRPMPTGGWVATHEDVTERRQASLRIDFLAKHDFLTGLPNRVSFSERLDAAAARLRRGHRFALLAIDLDRFKEVNDTLGHPIGDAILKQVALRLRTITRDDDVITRLSGDEFAVIQNDLGEATEAEALATRIIEGLSRPFEFNGHTVAIGASIGIAVAPTDGSEGAELLQKSDLALYKAKADSRGTFRFFEPGMDARLKERRELEADLRLAIQNGEFELHYQPILTLPKRSISGVEALIRWRHPRRGLLQPGDFISTAEETGLIIPIGEWVLRQACQDAAQWPADIRVAVNLSPAQFKRGDLLAMVMSALAAARLNPERLELEITESVLLHDETWVRSILERLRSLGVRIAMDDFGTGYSSLSYLRTFPFSKIKIDRTFVSDLADDADSRAIVQATIQLSGKLGMSITAEGVETEDQLDILASEGCTEIQGFHISRPVPFAEVAALIDRSYRIADAA